MTDVETTPKKAKELRDLSKDKDKGNVIGKAERELANRSAFIFDSNKVIKNAVFPLFKLDSDTFAYGFLLPKEKEVILKEKVMGKTQNYSPAIITSKQTLIEPSLRIEEDYKLKFNVIPSELELRWKLEDIKKYLDEKNKKIDGLELFNKIVKMYKKYLYFLKDDWYKIHSLWDIGTYCFILFKYYPIMEMRGFTGTAKSKVMGISSLITFNSSDIMINPSEATLFRETNDKRYTKYIDEAENLFKFEKGKIVSDQRAELINASYYYRGSVPRVEKIGNKFETIYYKCFSPTMIGSINGLYGATESRAITHITVKNPEGDTRGEIEPEEKDLIWGEIRNELYVYVLQNWKGIEETYNNLKNETTLKDRDFSIWKPLLSVAKLIDESLYQDIIKFSQDISRIKKMELVGEGTFDYKLLKIVYELIDLGQNPILIKKIGDKFKLDGDEKKPHSKTISSHLDRFGFLEFKVHNREGNGYEISKELFEGIIKPILPSIFASHSSHSSPNTNNEGYSQYSVKQSEGSELKL